MTTPEEKEFFLEHGYLHARGVLTGDHLATIGSEFDRVWDAYSTTLARPERIQRIAELARIMSEEIPAIAVVLGSGLGDFANTLAGPWNRLSDIPATLSAHAVQVTDTPASSPTFYRIRTPQRP